MAPPVRDPHTHVQLAFFREGRLTSLPSKRSVRLAALAMLVERFERDRRYPEREVNAILADDAPDVATLRRLLVDEGFLARAGGEYWRVDPVAG
jgi:ArsR family transcriptional regulator, arsenate/arsenite/antimonite-responsive transcriptional repressor